MRCSPSIRPAAFWIPEWWFSLPDVAMLGGSTCLNLLIIIGTLDSADAVRLDIVVVFCAFAACCRGAGFSIGGSLVSFGLIGTWSPFVTGDLLSTNFTVDLGIVWIPGDLMITDFVVDLRVVWIPWGGLRPKARINGHLVSSGTGRKVSVGFSCDVVEVDAAVPLVVRRWTFPSFPVIVLWFVLFRLGFGVSCGIRAYGNDNRLAVIGEQRFIICSSSFFLCNGTFMLCIASDACFWFWDFLYCDLALQGIQTIIRNNVIMSGSVGNSHFYLSARDGWFEYGWLRIRNQLVVQIDTVAGEVKRTNPQRFVPIKFLAVMKLNNRQPFLARVSIFGETELCDRLVN